MVKKDAVVDLAAVSPRECSCITNGKFLYALFRRSARRAFEEAADFFDRAGDRDEANITRNEARDIGKKRGLPCWAIVAIVIFVLFWVLVAVVLVYESMRHR